MLSRRRHMTDANALLHHQNLMRLSADKGHLKPNLALKNQRQNPGLSRKRPVGDITSAGL